MGGWDVLCAFCAGPFGVDGLDEDDGYDENVISVEEMKWLEDFRVFGFNPESFASDKCFITGPGLSDEYGGVHCHIGDDPNVPEPDGGYSPDDSGTTNITVYPTGEILPDDPFAVPFHVDCYRLLAQVISYHKSGRTEWSSLETKVIEREALWQVMKGLFEDYAHALTLDYGELNGAAGEQYWWNEPGAEAWVVNPFCPKIDKFMAALATDHTYDLNEEPETSAQVKNTEAQQSSFAAIDLPTLRQFSFNNLTPEILHEILLCLPYRDLQNFALSGLCDNSLMKVQSFWKRKLLIDMPWLWDLPPPGRERNWFMIYQELRRQCFATTATKELEHKTNASNVQGRRDTSLILGLANRRRIWKTCELLAVLYLQEIERTSSEMGEIEEESVAAPMTLIGHPVGKAALSLKTCFLESWKDLHPTKEMRFYFGEDGRLVGIKMLVQRIDNGTTFGSISDRMESVDIEQGIWISKFEFVLSGTMSLDPKAKVGICGVTIYLMDRTVLHVGSQAGSRRLLSVGPSMAFTGFVGEKVVNSPIQRLGLLLSAKNPFSTTPAPPTTPSTLSKILWSPSLPPKHLSASPYQTGYWGSVRSLETIPAQYIVLGTSLEELREVVGISGDAYMTNFAVHYVDGRQKVIGKREMDTGGVKIDEVKDKERKMFMIDGPGGERIVSVSVGMNALPQAIKIITNRNRTAFFGHVQKNAHHTLSEISNPETNTPKKFIAGIYGTWGYREAKCTTISVLAGDVRLGGQEEIGGGGGGKIDWEEKQAEEIQPVGHGITFSIGRMEGMRWVPGVDEDLALVEDGEWERERGEGRVW